MLTFFFECLTFQIRNIIRLIKWVEKNAPLFSLEKAAYYFGYIIGIIIDIIVETLISGGAAAVAKLAKSIESFLLNPIEKISKGIEKTVTFTKGLLTKVLEFLQMVIREFKKGAKELFAKFNKFLDEVFGLGEDVVSTPKTRAEERWNKKQERKQRKLERKKSSPQRKKQRRELFSTIKGNPIDKKLLTKLQKEFAELGGDMRFDEEAFEYIAGREKALKVEIEAITLGDDLIMLGPKATTSAVYEELIHAKQFRTGLYDEWANKYGNVIAENLMEKEAAEELLENAIKWELPKEEIELIKERLEFFNTELKELGYEN